MSTNFYITVTKIGHFQISLAFHNKVSAIIKQFSISNGIGVITYFSFWWMDPLVTLDSFIQFSCQKTECRTCCITTSLRPFNFRYLLHIKLLTQTILDAKQGAKILHSWNTVIKNPALLKYCAVHFCYRSVCITIAIEKVISWVQKRVQKSCTPKIIGIFISAIAVFVLQ